MNGSLIWVIGRSFGRSMCPADQVIRRDLPELVDRAGVELLSGMLRTMSPL